MKKTTTIRTAHIIVIAISALALLFGTAATGAVAGAKWINGKQIKPNSIPADRLKKATITGKQLKKGSIKGDRIARRSIGTQSLTNDAVDELQQTVVYTDHTFDVAAASPDTWVAAACPDDTQAVGGYMKPGGTASAFFTDAYVDAETNSFMVRVGGGQEPGQVTVQTICLR